jgi:hypothetical protein
VYDIMRVERIGGVNSWLKLCEIRCRTIRSCL